MCHNFIILNIFFRNLYDCIYYLLFNMFLNFHLIYLKKNYIVIGIVDHIVSKT